MKDHPPRLLLTRHDEARGIFEQGRQFVRLFETVVEDLGVQPAFLPKVAGADAMQLPVWKLIGQFGEGRPQFA